MRRSYARKLGLIDMIVVRDYLSGLMNEDIQGRKPCLKEFWYLSS